MTMDGLDELGALPLAAFAQGIEKGAEQTAEKLPDEGMSMAAKIALVGAGVIAGIVALVLFGGSK